MIEFFTLALVWWLVFISVGDIKDRIDRKYRQLRKRLSELEDTLGNQRSQQRRNAQRRPKPAYAALQRRNARRRIS